MVETRRRHVCPSNSFPWRDAFSRSNREIPTIDLVCTVDVSGLMRLRQRIGEETSRKPAYDSIFLFAVSRVIADFDNFRRHVSGDNVVAHETADLGVAISRQRELYTPVIRDADKLSLAEIDVEVRRLAEKTRAGKLRPQDMAGGSLTVSNLGMFPVRNASSSFSWKESCRAPCMRALTWGPSGTCPWSM